MNDFYNKIGLICSNILLYGQHVKSIEKPSVTNDNVALTVHDSMGNSVYIDIPAKVLCQLHDYKLSNYIIKIMQDYNL